MDFIHPDLPASDVPLFGLDEPKQLTAKTWEDLAVQCDAFPSKKTARKAGWQGAIPAGFSQRTLKRRGTTITVLNWFEE